MQSSDISTQKIGIKTHHPIKIAVFFILSPTPGRFNEL